MEPKLGSGHGLVRMSKRVGPQMVPPWLLMGNLPISKKAPKPETNTASQLRLMDPLGGLRNTQTRMLVHVQTSTTSNHLLLYSTGSGANIAIQPPV